MNNKIERMNTRFSTRALAMLMCFVMLFTAIGAGTMMTSFAAYKGDADTAGSDAVAADVAEAVDAEEADEAADIAIPDADSSEDIGLLSRTKDELIASGANVDTASTGASSYKFQTGARFYLNAYDGFSGGAKSYVYCAFIWNDYKNYSIIKMDHVANTDWYTCVTANGNIVDGANQERRGDLDGVSFFTSDSSTWATKTKEFSNNGAYADIQNNATTLTCYKSGLDGRNVYNNYVYYYNKNGYVNSYNGGNYLATNSSVTETRAGDQTAQVYISTNGTSYTASNAAGQGGEVQVGGYYWATDFTTSSKGFSDASSGTTRTSTYSKAVVTSSITMNVTTVYDGYYFMGWYNSSGTQLWPGESYTYKLTSTSSQTIHARFLKPTYDTTGTPATASQLESGNLILEKSSSSGDTPTRIWFWQGGGSGSVQALTRQGSTLYYTYSNSNITTTSQPKAIAFKTTTADAGSTTWPGDSYKISGDITPTGTNTSGIYYAKLADNTTANTWTNFEHLGVSLSGNPAKADVGQKITLSATKSGTLNSGAKLYYYFKRSTDANWYVISSNTTSASVDFYIPSYGSYTFRVTAADTAGFETAVADSSTTTIVGQEGFYVSGNTELVGEYWGVAPQKGYMTLSSGTVYTKTFGSVPAGTHEFRITSLTDWITDSSNHGTYTVNGETVSMNDNNFTFTLSASQQVTITYDSSSKNVTVTTADVQAIPVVVYSGSGGSVEVTYGTATTDIPAGENATINVAYGDKITLTATPAGGSTFSLWKKNMEASYSAEATINNETITKRTVYVAKFGGGSSSWVYSADRSAATPEIGGNTSGYNIIYSASDTGVGRNEGNPHGSEATYKSGSEYWADLTSVFSNNSNPTRLYIALANGTGNNNMVGNTSTQINGTAYSNNNGPTLTNADNETLFIARVKQNSTVSNSIYYIELDGIDWSKISALGVRAVYSGSGAVNYKFYYKLSGASGGDDDYEPTTNYYAKDGVIRDYSGSKTFQPKFSQPDTVVTPVEDEVTVTQTGSSYKWDAGLALKGSTITVTTTIPDTGSYSAVKSDGTTATFTARQKFYVAGFSFNGVTPQILEERDDGVYTCSYTIPADMKETMLEVTPIYFIKEEYASNTMMIYLNGYNDEIKNAGWGNTLFLYPFYKVESSTYEGQAQNYGAYPGQPVINYGGQLYSQIPLTDTGLTDGSPIKGITINNGYYDYVHKDCCKHVSVHRQTYDYDDFAKIYNQKSTKNGSKYLYSIYFSFKYFPQNVATQHRLNSTTSNITENKGASRYNDLLADGNILNNTNGTVAKNTLITAGNNSTGWEYLTDALGNQVDLFGNKVTNSDAEPLRVFSLGYEYNNAGRWATEWAVYHLNGSNYELIYDNAWGIDSTHKTKDYNSSIVPSALIYNDSTTLKSATSYDGDLSIAGYAGLYDKLTDYAGVPVYICYEHDIPDNFDPKNYRSDGRWTYTTVNDFVQSKIQIEYYDKNGDLQTDSFAEGSNVGTITGCKAYFTNSDYYGATTSASEIINGSQMYTFTAEEAGSYEFVGWYMYDTHKKESTITTNSLNGETPRSGNFTLVARYKYIADGTLTISNSLDSNSTGRGTTYLGVTMINGDKETVLANVNSNTAPVKIDKSYINANSNYQIRIEIKTVPTGENQFTSYAAYTTDSEDNRSAATNPNIYSAGNASSTSDSYTITVKGDVFDSVNTNTQNVKAIEYVSSLKAVNYEYSVTFKYKSRQFEGQAFTQAGSLTSGQINDPAVVDTTNHKLTAAFLAKIAPHESNFNEPITWDFDAAASGEQTHSYEPSTNTHTISLTIDQKDLNGSEILTNAKKRYGMFTVPYAVDATTHLPTAGVQKAAEGEESTFRITTTYDGLFKYDGTDDMISALAEIDDTSGNTWKFQYWEIKTISSDLGDSVVVGKCYFPEFNYRAFDNYYVTAIYSKDADAKDFGSLYADNEFVTIDFIGNTRNQWNNGDKGEANYYAGDLIYNDFIMNFKPQSADLIKDIDGAKVGMVIQRLKLIEVNSSGKNAKTLQEYAKDYSEADLAAAQSAAENKINGSNTTGYTQINVPMELKDVNNKNRIHYVYSFYNTVQTSSTADVSKPANCKYLYRAYSYMIVNDTIHLSDTPAYFYMYDIANE